MEEGLCHRIQPLISFPLKLYSRCLLQYNLRLTFPYWDVWNQLQSRPVSTLNASAVLEVITSSISTYVKPTTCLFLLKTSTPIKSNSSLHSSTGKKSQMILLIWRSTPFSHISVLLLVVVVVGSHKNKFYCCEPKKVVFPAFIWYAYHSCFTIISTWTLKCIWMFWKYIWSM